MWDRCDVVGGALTWGDVVNVGIGAVMLRDDASFGRGGGGVVM